MTMSNITTTMVLLEMYMREEGSLLSPSSLYVVNAPRMIKIEPPSEEEAPVLL